MHPYLVVVLWVALVLAVFFGLIIWNNHKQKKILLNRIRRNYGSVPTREYEVGDIEKISHYFRRREDQGFVIDDITWNDLDMDRVFMMINQTVSSPGEDVLYSMLRTPVFSEEEMEERKKLADFFAENGDKREKMQWYLSRMGKTAFGSLSDTVLALSEAPEVSPSWSVVLCAAALFSLFVVIPLSPLHGFLLFLIVSVVNVTVYFAGANRKKVSIYTNCFTLMLQMLSAADRMNEVKWPELEKQMKAIREAKKAFGGFRKKAFIFTSKNESDGDPVQLLMDYVRMVFHVDILAYNSVLREVRGKVGYIMQLIDNIGELDAAISIASFRELLVLKCEPEFVPREGGETELFVEDLYHPLISQPVANSIHAKGGTLVTGSNASGKSTFLKNVAMNSILAQTIGVCTASVYRAPFLKVMTSMALRDDLSGGESYFIVEIKSLKRILDESKQPEPLLCIIDEVLRGTNTIERIAASSRILRELKQPWVLPFAATHDIELSYILDKYYENYHFEEEVRENEVVFNYLLLEGRAKTRNAIKLLGMLGYDEKLVTAAEEAAKDFERKGTWGGL